MHKETGRIVRISDQKTLEELVRAADTTESEWVAINDLEVQELKRHKPKNRSAILSKLRGHMPQ